MSRTILCHSNIKHGVMPEVLVSQQGMIDGTGTNTKRPGALRGKARLVPRPLTVIRNRFYDGAS